MVEGPLQKLHSFLSGFLLFTPPGNPETMQHVTIVIGQQEPSNYSKAAQSFFFLLSLF